METRDIIVVGASTGGIEAVCSLIKDLPGDLPASVFVVQHVAAQSGLARILTRCGPLKVISPAHGEKIQRGRVYVAPGDHHLLIENGHIELSKRPRENRHRPSVDALFRSAARAYRERVIAVVLSGALDDGALGAFAVKARGGLVVVQDPEEAMMPSMPCAAMRAVKVDYALPVAAIAALLPKCVRQAKEEKHRKPSDVMKAQKKDESRESVSAGPFTCPDCSGPLYRTEQGKMVQIHCIVGHSYSPESLGDAHREALERSILTTMRMLKERAAIHRTIAENTGEKDPDLAARFKEDVAAAEKDAALLQEILERI